MRARKSVYSYQFKRSMAEKRGICNLEAHDKYIKKFKSDWEAAGLFIRDEGLLSEEADVSKLKKHWANKMGTLRRKWSRLNRSKKLDQTKEAFVLYQKQAFYEPTIMVD